VRANLRALEQPHRAGLGGLGTLVPMLEIGHDILVGALALLTVAVFAAMAWAGRVH
jgi:hypothetical protein